MSSGLETEYVGPAKQFLTESFQAYPAATTTAVIFAVTSFVPVVSAIALTVFASFVALAGTLVVVVGLALSLAVVLSRTLVFSVVVDFLFQFRSGGAAAQRSADGRSREERHRHLNIQQPPPRRLHSPQNLHHDHPLLSSAPLEYPSLPNRTPLLAFLLLRNPLARTLLPRWLRYHALATRTSSAARAQVGCAGRAVPAARSGWTGSSLWVWCCCCSRPARARLGSGTCARRWTRRTRR
ncbi:hypothetical protein C8R47DRAFT_117309 [Mycena vitilis]|nr:hypothetical protein C8R47DRAFT_117309 [Mycena vitilis]